MEGCRHRNLLPWLDEDVASRTVDDRLALMRRIWGDAGLSLYSVQSERVRLLTRIRTAMAGRTIPRFFLSGFDARRWTVASSVPAGSGPFSSQYLDIWRLTDTNGMASRTSVATFESRHGVRISMRGA